MVQHAITALGHHEVKLLTVSQVARRTGITVRTLHHYEAKDLLKPARRNQAGYRLYGEAELGRLQHIVSLKALGFSLAEIHQCLLADAPTLGEALTRQIGRLRKRVVRQRELLLRLERVAQRLGNGELIDGESLLSSIEASTLMEKHFTPDQMQQIRQRGEELGPERIRAVEQAWPDVIAGMKAAMQLDKDPASEEVQALAKRWCELLREFTGGDNGIQRSLNRMYREEPGHMRQQTGIDPELMTYARKAIAGLSD